VKRAPVVFFTAFLALVLALAAAPAPDSFRFVILGDRTGEAVPGVYEQIWQESAAQNPAFVLSVGDAIQGGNDATAEAEWRQFQRIARQSTRIPLYLTPGNHDIWSPLSEMLFRKYAAHPPHYSFDYRQAHFTVLDNSRSGDLPPSEMDFLEMDLAAHAAQPLKIIVSHRPSWLLNVALRNENFSLERLAKKYGVKLVLAGHVHQILYADLEGVSYLSAPSAGGHLRLSGKYEDGWFFGHILAEVQGANVKLQIEEAKPPHGNGRVTPLEDWGASRQPQRRRPQRAFVNQVERFDRFQLRRKREEEIAAGRRMYVVALRQRQMIDHVVHPFGCALLHTAVVFRCARRCGAARSGRPVVSRKMLRGNGTPNHHIGVAQPRPGLQGRVRRPLRVL